MSGSLLLLSDTTMLKSEEEGSEAALQEASELRSWTNHEAKQADTFVATKFFLYPARF
jgi:hypothetical protein